MDRLVNVLQLWNWLPAFRAVAELQNVRAAADRLHVSPSALSRTLRLLEEQLGLRLFDRNAGVLRLNASGEQLLARVRDAMRLVDEGVVAANTQTTQPLRVLSPSDLASALVWPACARLVAKDPRVIPHLSQDSVPELKVALLTGVLDAALAHEASAAPGLEVEVLGELESGIYCGPSHPLFGKRAVTLETLLRFPFVGSEVRAPLSLSDRWPAELARDVRAYVPSLHLAIDVCESTALLAALPHFAVRRAVAQRRLHCVSRTALPALPVLLVRRRSSRADDVVTRLCTELRAGAAALSRTHASRRN